jgi:hypothetical protein
MLPDLLEPAKLELARMMWERAQNICIFPSKKCLIGAFPSSTVSSNSKTEQSEQP